MEDLVHKVSQKNIFLILFFGLLLSGLIFVYHQIDILRLPHYNQDRNVYAQEEIAAEKPIVCKIQSEIELPLGIDIKLGPNELEIPIGETTDKTEDIAQKIAIELQEIMDASQVAIATAKAMVNSAGECSLKNCTTPGCSEEDYDCYPHPCTIDPLQICFDKCRRCVHPTCGGNACPQAELAGQLDTVHAEVGKVGSAYKEIDDILFEAKRNKPIGLWWCDCSPITPCYPPIPGITIRAECRTDAAIILDKLEKSRSGDYQFYNFLLDKLEWNHKPPGLKDCVIRPEDENAIISGEKAGKWLFSCKEALNAGMMDECYGQTKCEDEAKRRTPPTDWLCPRMENYYCCE